MNTIKKIQEWYYSQCDEDWKHQYGVSITNLDNPGWSVKIDLEDTDLEDTKFKQVSYGIGKEAEDSGDNWLICNVKNKSFIASGGPFKLDEILQIFLRDRLFLHIL